MMGAGRNILVKILAYNPKGIYVFLKNLFSWEQNKGTVVVVVTHYFFFLQDSF